MQPIQATVEGLLLLDGLLEDDGILLGITNLEDELLLLIKYSIISAIIFSFETLLIMDYIGLAIATSHVHRKVQRFVLDKEDDDFSNLAMTS